MDASGTTLQTFSYGLTDEEVAQLRKEGKDEWYHKKVLTQISGYTAAQEIPDRVYDFRRGPPYQLSSVDWQSPVRLQMGTKMATKPRKGLDRNEDEETKEIVQSIRSKDSRFSVGFVRCLRPDSKPKASIGADTPKSPPMGSWSLRDNSSDGACRTEPTDSGLKLDSPFHYQPNPLKRKPTPSPDVVSNGRKHTRLEDPDSLTVPAKLKQPSLSARLPTPADSRQSTPLERFQHGVTYELQLCTQNLTLSVISVLIRSYKVMSRYDSVTERHPDDNKQIKLRWDASKETLSVHDACSDCKIFEANGIQVPLLVYQNNSENGSQAMFLEKWEAKGNPTVLAAALICIDDVEDDARFSDMITVFKHCIGPSNVRSEDSAIFWNGKCSELHGEKNDPSITTLSLETTEYGLGDAQALTSSPVVAVPKKKKELSKAKKEHDKKYSKQNRQKKRKIAAATKAAAATNEAADDDYAPVTPDNESQNTSQSQNLSTQNQTPALPSSNSTTTQVSRGESESVATGKTKRVLHPKGLTAMECARYPEVFGRRW